jgi:hypothetical protein
MLLTVALVPASVGGPGLATDLLPLLLFECAWKLLWLGRVAAPRATNGTLDAATSQVLVNCSLVVVILAVTPSRYVWEHYLRTAGDAWTTRKPLR